MLTQQAVKGQRRKPLRIKSERRSVYSFLPSAAQSFPSLFVLAAVCICVRAHSWAHLNLLLITSHTSRLSGGLLTLEDYQQPEPFNPFFGLPAPTWPPANEPIRSLYKLVTLIRMNSCYMILIIFLL